MSSAVEFLTHFGAGAAELVWLPLAAWTVLWVLAEAALRLSPAVHPMLRYRATQALMLALPMGLALGAVLDIPALLPASVAVGFIPEMGMTSPVVEILPLGPGMAIDVPPPAPTVSAATVFGGAFVLAAIAAAGLLVRLVRQGVAVARLRRQLQPATVPGLDEAARAAAARFGVDRRVEVMAAEGVEVPMTFGLRRPLIVLPPWLEEGQRRMAVMHEMAHVRHFDAAAQWLEAGLVAIFAFHPGMHRLRRQCELLRELSCDAALLVEAAVSRRQYAALLFTFVSPPARIMPVTIGMADRRSHITRRLEAMKAFQPTAIPYRLALTVAIAVFCGGSVLLSASHVLAQEPEQIPLRLERASDASEQRLFIVDGYRVEAFDLDALEPSEVQSIEFLRGPAAVERFGQAAVSGVVLITTQSGSESDARPAPRLQILPVRFHRSSLGDGRYEIRADGQVMRGLERVADAEVFLLGLSSRVGPSRTGSGGAFSIVTGPVRVGGPLRIEVRHSDYGTVTVPFEPHPPSSEQSAHSDDPPIFVVVEEMPVPVGGLQGIQQRVRYPELARRAGIEGTVFVQFVVNVDGSVSELRCVRDPGAGTCEAAIHAIQDTEFEPGRQQGQPVRVRFSLPVRFQLDDSAEAQTPRGSLDRQLFRVTVSEGHLAESSLLLRGDVRLMERTRDGLEVSDARATGTRVSLAAGSWPETAEGAQRIAEAITDSEGGFEFKVPFSERWETLFVQAHDVHGGSNGVMIPADRLRQDVANGDPADARERAATDPIVEAARGSEVQEFGVRGAFPNPTTSELTVAFDLPEPADVRLELLDVAGRRVVEVPNRSFDAGADRRLVVDIRSLASGVYVFRLQAGTETVSGRVTITR